MHSSLLQRVNMLRLLMRCGRTPPYKQHLKERKNCIFSLMWLSTSWAGYNPVAFKLINRAPTLVCIKFLNEWPFGTILCISTAGRWGVKQWVWTFRERCNLRWRSNTRKWASLHRVHTWWSQPNVWTLYRQQWGTFAASHQVIIS